MSLKKKAAQVRAKGKKNIGQDSILAHINPREAMLLKMRGGSGRRDPSTGLPHFDEAGDPDGGGGYGGGLDGAPDTGTIGGGGYGTDADGADLGGPDSPGLGGGWSDMFNGYDSGLGFGDSNLGGFQDVGGYASPAQATGWNDAMSAQDSVSDSVFNESNARRGLGFASSLLGGIPGMAINSGLAATSKDPGKGFGSMAGGLIGGLLAGPVGAFAGSQLGGRGLSGMGASTPDAAAGVAGGRAAGNSGNTSTDFDLGGALTGLAGLYQGSQANGVNQTAINNNAQGMQFAQQQAQQLADMYGPNSPYAQQLRQGLERKDAAAGRRSQYGPREVELQARLAEMQSRNAPNILNANKQFMDANQSGVGYGNAANKTNGQQLAGLFSLANKTGLTGMAQRGLGDLWNGMGSGGATNGVGGFSEAGQSFNNPSAYTAPESGGNFWDGWF